MNVLMECALFNADCEFIYRGLKKKHKNRQERKTKAFLFSPLSTSGQHSRKRQQTAPLENAVDTCLRR